MHRSNNKDTGFTLIEVLVALVVLAIGLLGLAGLQATGIKNNLSAYQRSQATQLAYDLSDRLRVNKDGVSNGNYNNQAGTSNNCETNICTTAQMAGYDLTQWNTTLAAELPNGSGVVCIDSTSNDGTAAAPACDGSGTTYAIKVWWTDDREAQNANAAIRRFVMSFRP